jgi:hypothetical protein
MQFGEVWLERSPQKGGGQKENILIFFVVGPDIGRLRMISGRWEDGRRAGDIGFDWVCFLFRSPRHTERKSLF